MRHASARRIIARLLLGQGFGEQAISQALMATLQDRDDCPETLKQLLDHVEDLGTDSARPYIGPLNQAPIPHDQRELCAQLAPTLIDHPDDMGMNLASLLALVQLWPHVSGDERPLMRVRFLNGLTSRVAPEGSFATRDHLRAWQRGLPTAYGADEPHLGDLQALLVEATPERAYRCLAAHLDPRIALPRIGHVIGALSLTLLRQFHDRDGLALHVLLGSVAIERLAEWVEPEHLATLVAQLSHQLWWSRQRAHLPPVLLCLDTTPLPLVDAVRTGDVTLAQRAARAASQNPEGFWEDAWQLLADSVSRRDEHWPRALGMVSAIAWRGGANAVSPDDAAALASVFADIAHQRDRIVI